MAAQPSTTMKSKKPLALLSPDQAGINLPGAGQDWLDALRTSATTQFTAQGLPTVRDEEWRYTDLRKLKRQQFAVAKTVPDVRKTLAKIPNYGLPRIVLVNGFYAPACSTRKLPTGIKVSALSMRLEDNSLRGLIGSTLPSQTHAFTALNTAYCLDGAVIEITDKTVIEQPIELIHVVTEAHSVSHAHNIIVAGKLSQASIIERSLASLDDMVYLNNSVTEIIANDGVKLEHYKIQQDAKTAFHVGGVFINQGRDSTVVNHNMALGGDLVRNDVHLNLLGSNAHGEMNGLVVGHGTQHVHNHTEVDHRVPHCSSDEYYKTVLDEKSRAIFRGRIIVAQDAQKTSAEQQNNNLLLSADAEANTKPQLEIYADDVECSHGATIGQLDAKSLFYLQSRGINKDDARRLLMFAFVNEILDRIDFEPLQIELTKRFLGELLPDTYQEVFS